jgi:hypothetical protein
MTGRMLAVVGIACMFGATLPTPTKSTIPVLVRHGPVRIQRQRNLTQWDSTNWSGYAATGPNKSVSNVKGSWIVPAARCTGGSEEASDAYASFWIGIDGWTSNTVEQIGTDSDCVSVAGKDNVPTYYAWFEFFPQPAFYIGDPGNGFNGFVVEPGDVMSAEVKAGSGGKFTLMISDTRSGVKQWTYVTSSIVTGAQQSSAEWIAETPCCERNGSFFPLTNFGAEHYGDSFTDVENTSFATVGGQTGPIGSFGNVQEITMVNEGAPAGSPKGTLMAQPSILAAGGTSFSVNWQNWGP